MEEVIYRLNKLTNEVEHLTVLVNSLTNLEERKEEKEFYSLKEAIELKYGNSISEQTVKTNYLLQPCCNSNYVIRSGRKFWDKDKIHEWLKINDCDIPAYAAKYGVPLVGRLGEKYKKYTQGGKYAKK